MARNKTTPKAKAKAEPNYRPAIAVTLRGSQAKAKAESNRRPAIAVTLRGSAEWKQWVEGLADYCRLDVAKLIDRALIDMARKEGYKTEAPSR